MIIILSLLVLLLGTSTGILFWYCRKTAEQLKFAVQNVDAYQELLDQYLNSLKAIFKMDEYYGDDTIAVLIEHTKMVSEACKAFKYTMIEEKNDKKAEESESSTEESK